MRSQVSDLLPRGKADGSPGSPGAGTSLAAPPAQQPAERRLSEKRALEPMMGGGSPEAQSPSLPPQQSPNHPPDWAHPAAGPAVAERVPRPTAQRVGALAGSSMRGIASPAGFAPKPPSPAPAPPAAAPAAAAPAAPRPARLPLEQRVAAQMAHPPASWGVAEVCDWLEAFGMGQYRKRFVHHAVSGQVLLKLTDQRLRADLGVGSLGHREGLLRAVAELRQQHQGGGGAQGPASGATLALAHTMSPSALAPPGAPAGSAAAAAAAVAAPAAAAALRAQEQRARLEKKLDKAQARVALRRAAAEQAARTHSLAEQDVRRLRDALAGAAARAGGGQGGARRASAGCEAAAVDSRGTPVWCPAGRAVPAASRKALPGGPKPADPAAAAAAAAQGAGVSFLDRLEADLAARQAKAARVQGAGGAPAAPCAPGGASPEQAALAFVQELLADRDAALLEALGSGSPARAAAALDAAAAQLAEDINLPSAQLEAVKAAGGVGEKAVRLAAAVRTSQFMQRLAQDLAVRQGRGQELRQRWRADEAEAAAAQEARDVAEARARFEGLGWAGEVAVAGGSGGGGGGGGGEELLGALLRRARAAQQAQQAGKPVDWEPFRADGLLALSFSKAAAPPPPPPPPLPAAPASGEAAADPSAAVGAPAAAAAAPPAEGSAALLEAVQLLAGCRGDELGRLEALTGQKKALAVHRSLRAQAFLRFTRADLAAKAAKREEALAAAAPPRRTVPKEHQEAFLQRLMEDAVRRTKNRCAAQRGRCIRDDRCAARLASD
jgi:hypothetical protein